MKIRKPVHDNWATPKELYNLLDSEFNFDFDPCPLNYTVDGLAIEWGKSNFINPPYSRKLKEAFINKALEESKKGKLCVLLLPVSTSTKIFHDVVLPNGEIRFFRGRPKFSENGTEKPTSGQPDNMLVIFNKQEVLI